MGPAGCFGSEVRSIRPPALLGRMGEGTYPPKLEKDF